MLLSNNAYPHDGNAVSALHIMYDLKGKHNSRLALDPTYPAIVYEKFETEKDWTAFYGDVEEEIPPNSPTLIGKSADLQMMVNIDHAGDNINRRSRTGFTIFVNLDLVQFLLKTHPTAESTVFGAKFVAMKHGLETLQGIWYKLYIYGDNMFVIYNTLITESALRKKSNIICYYLVREALAAKECLTSHIPTLKNLSDLLIFFCMYISAITW